MIVQRTLTLSTSGRGTHELTRDVQKEIRASGVQTGLCHLFIQHTSASLILCENADPTVRDDLDDFLGRLVVDGDPHFSHRAEGADDMSAHIRSILTHNDLTLPVSNGLCALGTWQGIYLYEHRAHPHQRRVILTISGD